MRYPDNAVIPVDQLASHSSDGMLILTSIMGVIIGIILTGLGKYGKQMWMFYWGIGLVIVSIYMGVKIW